MKGTKFFQRLMVVLLVLTNLSIFLWRYQFPLEEILLSDMCLVLLFLAVKSSLDLVRSQGLHENLEEQL